MTTLIACGNIQTPFPFQNIPALLVPPNLLTLNSDNPRVQQCWQCRRLAHFLLWQLLKTSGKPTALLGQISRTENGRPQFPVPDIDFNISHSGDWVVVILHIHDNGGKSAVGIDIESPRKERPYLALLAHFAPAEEIRWFQQQPDEKSAFYRIWCLREAVLKSQGAGIVRLSEVTHLPDTQEIYSRYCPRGQLIFSDQLPFYLAFFVNQNPPHSLRYFVWNGEQFETQMLLQKIRYDVNI
ncbi:4'-phosphopantetheinyl transferase family protein [Aggregatibacter actinomycetemcomitans]|uniref:4'-phosphopantetheinyl transferase family protein n=1 Tax=Aggregatibacter actinomycetemcomitans TaxID=714 RepID=UPI00197C7BED|nr:4'-phosphopantetheinyl transferase superfamily protein [Aggregatibacter actinomycetemcomitans]MBN6063127.1 4'-phosphopantetheinyl transferase superfamily protein [Aggregatibacter actinomycetemcomitans]MBN6083022.1 4'-phosphopantetheinyl transferase superfamily protein [Aggregatibacter actinomycetemcomitans]